MPKTDSPSSQRQLRVGEEVRRALAWIMERGEIRDPQLAARTITITEVRISPDLRQATVFFVPLGGAHEEGLIAALERAKGFLRHRIGSEVRLRCVPNMHFRIDRSFDVSDRIDRALRDPRVARDLNGDRSGDQDEGQSCD